MNSGSEPKALSVRKERIRAVITKHLGGTHVAGADPDIVVVSSPRSGSTWLMEALSDQPGYKYVNEPDHRDLLRFHRLLSIEPRWAWLELDPVEADELRRFLYDDRRTRLFGPAKPRELLHSHNTHRRVIKVVRMNALIDWFAEIGFMPIYLLRHPIPQALSSIARGHAIHLSDYILSDRFRAHLSAQQLNLVKQTAADGTALQQFVTQWCLENLLPLRSDAMGEHIVISTHEARVKYPEREIQRIGQAVRIPDIERIRRHSSSPSRVTDTSSKSTVSSIQRGRSAELLGRWRNRIGRSHESQLMSILDQFEIATYSVGSDLPTLPHSWTRETTDGSAGGRGGAMLDTP